MRRVLILFCAGFLLSCAEAENGNQDSSSEQSCSSASGVWTMSTASCDGASVTPESIAFDFTSATSATQSQGNSTCSSELNLDVAHDATLNSIALTGNGNYSCAAAGSSTASCSDGGFSCDNSVDATGIQNNFDTCAISGSEMTLIRTVSSVNNPNNMSHCADGEAEVITLTQASTDPSGPALLSIAGADPYDFGSVSVGGSAQIALTVSNDGGEAATSIAGSGLATPFNFQGGSYPGTGGDCGATLAASSSCTIVVTFDPVAVGVSNDSLQLDYNDGSAAQSLSHGLTGTGVSASLANLVISESDPYDYGSVVMGGVQSHTFTVTNTGSGTATAISEVGLASPFNFAGGSYPGTGGTCAASLVSAGSCDIEVEFAPVSVGVNSDTISLSYNNGASTVTSDRDVTGTGLAPALLIISDGPVYDFGSVATSSSTNYLFTVTNTGGGTASGIIGSGLAAPFSYTGGAYPGVSGTCSAFIAPGSNCTIDVTFAPTAGGAFADTIFINYNDGASAQSATRDVQGTGL